MVVGVQAEKHSALAASAPGAHSPVMLTFTSVLLLEVAAGVGPTVPPSLILRLLPFLLSAFQTRPPAAPEHKVCLPTKSAAAGLL